MTIDLGFKITSVLTTIIVLPLFGWVWTTNTDVKQLEYEHSDAVEDVKELQTEIKEMKNNETQIKLLQKDIDFIKKEVKDISRHIKGTPL